MVLLVTSPLVSPASFVLAWGGLGPAFALTKLASALVIGLAAGLLTHHLVRGGALTGQIQPAVFKSAGAAAARQQRGGCVAAGSGDCGARVALADVARATAREFTQRSWRMSIFVGRFVLLGLVAQALLVRYLPQSWIEEVLGAQNQFSVLVAAAVGLPAYVNGMAAIPLLRGLLDKGMDPGAVVAFLIAGPVATVPSIIAVTALVRRRAVAVYLLSGLIGAIAFGYAFDVARVVGSIR